MNAVYKQVYVEKLNNEGRFVGRESYDTVCFYDPMPLGPGNSMILKDVGSILYNLVRLPV